MKNSLYNDFAVRFAASTLTSLVENFNQQVGKRAFNSAHAAFDQALVAELIKRGIDISAVFDGTVISFSNKVRLDNKSLVVCE